MASASGWRQARLPRFEAGGATGGVAAGTRYFYNPDMRLTLCFIIVLSVSVRGQPTDGNRSSGDKLTSILVALRSAKTAPSVLSPQLRDEMMAIAAPDRKPSTNTLGNFASELTDALFAKSIRDSQLAIVRSSITDLLRGTTSNYDSATRLREALVGIKVDQSRVQRIITRFIRIGEEIRGPDDLPASAVE